MIEGVKVIPLRKIPDERGAIYHMLKRTDPHFTTFGEIYFSKALPGAIKGWHLHGKMTIRYAVVSGMVKMVLYDMRENSPTKGELMEVFLGDDNYSLLIVPPGVANGFTAIGGQPALVANCPDIPHDPDEITRIDPLHNDIPYDWAIKHG